MFFFLLLPLFFSLWVAGAEVTEVIEIWTLKDLNDVRNNLNAHYLLRADLDFAGSPWAEDAGWLPIGSSGEKFTGTFDGNGKTIANLYINRPDTGYQGLFGHVEGAEIRNVNLVGVNISGADYVGGVVGKVGPGSTISNCHATGTVQGRSNTGGLAGDIAGSPGNSSSISNSSSNAEVSGQGSYIGGLVGRATRISISGSSASGSVAGKTHVGGLVGSASGTEIVDSFATGDATGSVLDKPTYVGGLVGVCEKVKITSSFAQGAVSGGENIGGLVGYAYNNTEISFSYADGHVSGSRQAGGLAGCLKDNSSIRDSYATGNVSAGTLAGGLTGILLNSSISRSYAFGFVEGRSGTGGLVGGIFGGQVEDAYYDSCMTGQSDTGKGTPLVPLEMMRKETFTGWDFAAVWAINEGASYPYLRWSEKIPAPRIEEFSLNPRFLELAVGDDPVTLEVRLVPECLAGVSLTWESSAEFVAEVDEGGAVIPVGPGEAVITASVLGGKYNATCSVTVLEPPPEGEEEAGDPYPEEGQPDPEPEQQPESRPEGEPDPESGRQPEPRQGDVENGPGPEPEPQPGPRPGDDPAEKGGFPPGRGPAIDGESLSGKPPSIPQPEPPSLGNVDLSMIITREGEFLPVVEKPYRLQEPDREILIPVKGEKAGESARKSLALRAFYWNEIHGKWVPLASYPQGHGVRVINDGGYTGWFAVFAVREPFFIDLKPGQRDELILNRAGGLTLLEGYPHPSDPEGFSRLARPEKAISPDEFFLVFSRALRILLEEEMAYSTFQEALPGVVFPSENREDGGKALFKSLEEEGALAEGGILKGKLKASSSGSLMEERKLSASETQALLQRTLEAIGAGVDVSVVLKDVKVDSGGYLTRAETFRIFLQLLKAMGW